MKFDLKFDGKNIEIEVNTLAEQANGSALVKCGGTVVLATAVMAEEDKESQGFFPLTVEYQEKYYAAGKIKGSRFIKREARPSDEAIINARLIDRTIRPRFPKELAKEIQVISTVLSWDGENDPDVLSIMAASTALLISDIPWNGPLGAVRVCRKDGKFALNLSYKEKEAIDMDIIFVGLYEGREFLINMIEGGFNEVDEKSIIEAYDFAEKHIKNIIDFQKEIQKKTGKGKIALEAKAVDLELQKEIDKFLGDKYEKAFFQKDKTKRNSGTNDLKKDLVLFVKEKYPNDEAKIRYVEEFLEEESCRLFRKAAQENKRVDGRDFDEVRKISAAVAILPRTHGTGLFSRGETKSLSILTLGAPGDQQLIEGMEGMDEKKFMHHYNFPPYSVGEVSPLRGPGRREIGHGLLAEKALKPLIPKTEDFPYTVRIVTEILSSNGSSSMASVSSSSLALMDAGVPIKALATGVAMGLVKGEDDYKIITDIQGPEDHYGDMDFKVAGTRQGITAIQMDVKIEGLSREIIEKTLEKANKARHFILDAMEKVISKPNPELSSYAPRILTIQIKPEKIGEVIGPGGKVINKIIEETGVQIDIEDSGQVFITADNKEGAQKAVEWINGIVEEPEIGKIYKGEVKKIMDFGAFVEILPGKDGLVHISKLSDKRVDRVEDIVNVGDIIFTKVIFIDSQGRINLKLVKK